MIPRLFPGPHELEIDVPEGVSVEALRRQIKSELRKELQDKAPAIIRGVRAKTKTARRALTELSHHIYERPGALRRFAEAVRNGALGHCISRVYFIERVTDGAIKIGVSELPDRRLTEMQVVVPERLRLIFAFNGDRATEKLLHQAFAPDSIRGEWYRPSKVIAEFMRIMQLDDPKYPHG